MMSVLYVQTGFLPKKRGQIVRDIVDMYTLRAQERGIYFEDTDQMLLDLGELAYKASQKDTHQLLISKVVPEFILKGLCMVVPNVNVNI